MPVIAVFDLPNMSTTQYDQVMRDLNAAGAASPAGRLYHVMSATPKGAQVVDVWESQEKLTAFFGTLGPLLVRNGVTPPKPVITPVHNIVAPLANGAEQRNTETVRQAYAAFARGDVKTILTKLAPNVDWVVEAEPGSTVPWHLSVSRREDVPAFFKAVADNLDVTHFEPVEIVAAGNSVAVRISSSSVVRKNGQTVGGESTQWFTFDDSGLCIRWHACQDTAADVEAWSWVAPATYPAHPSH